MQNIMTNMFMTDTELNNRELTIQQIGDQLSHDFDDKYIKKFNENIDTFSSHLNDKSLEEKISAMSDCDVVLVRLSKQVFNDYNIDYLKVKKYYELESEDEFDYSIHKNIDIYKKCNRNESCVQLIDLFTDSSSEEELVSNQIIDNKLQTRSQRKRRMIFNASHEIPKKKKTVFDNRLRDQVMRPNNKSSDKAVSDRLRDQTKRAINRSNERPIAERLRDHSKRPVKRSSDGKSVNKNVINNNNSLKSSQKREFVINGKNNVINIINNKKIENNSLKSKKKKRNANYKNLRISLSTSTPIKQTSVTGNNSFCDNLFNDSNTVNNSSEIIDYKTFMGTRFRSNDLFHKCNDCENGCEVDELSLAFHLLITSPEDQLPNDLRVNSCLDLNDNEESEEVINENNNNSDNELNIFPNINDIYRQTIEEESVANDLQLNPNLFLGIDDFLKNTTTQVPNNLPIFDPFIPSTSSYSHNSNLINAEQVLLVEQDLGIIASEILPSLSPLIENILPTDSMDISPVIDNIPVTPLINRDINTKVIISPISNTSTQVTDIDLNSSSTLTPNSQKKAKYECVHCLATFERNKLFRQHCSDVHPGLPKRCTALSPTNSPIKGSPLNINDSQNCSTSPSFASVIRKIQFN